MAKVVAVPRVSERVRKDKRENTLKEKERQKGRQTRLNPSGLSLKTSWSGMDMTH